MRHPSSHSVGGMSSPRCVLASSAPACDYFFWLVCRSHRTERSLWDAIWPHVLVVHPVHANSFWLTCWSFLSGSVSNCERLRWPTDLATTQAPPCRQSASHAPVLLQMVLSTPPAWITCALRTHLCLSCMCPASCWTLPTRLHAINNGQAKQQPEAKQQRETAHARICIC